MARRTKEDALATRESILDAAECLFASQGVSGTTMQHIASAAGITRGAVYWHFADKADVFGAMMERAKAPFELAMQVLDRPVSAEPVRDLRESITFVFREIAQNPQARRVFEIASAKLEYVGELAPARARRMAAQAQWMARAESRIAMGLALGQVKPGTQAHPVALGLWAVLDGLIRTWLLDPGAFDLIYVGAQTVDMLFDALRAG